MQQQYYNFCAGPAALPTTVLQRAQDELLNWQGRGVSVMEMSHRHPAFMELAETAEINLRRLLNIPNHYKVLFLQGGATTQFAVLPMNLLADLASADYLDTGIWSAKAIAAMAPFGQARLAANFAGKNQVPSKTQLQLDPQAAYVHYCPNETISGLAFDYVPDTGSVPLVADMSSVLLSTPLEVNRFGLIYAGAQKNIGPAGLTLVIVREDLLGRARPETPGPLNYTLQAAQNSMLNTPPTLAWYLAAMVFEWLLEQGGLSTIAEQNQLKARLLYEQIDSSTLYINTIKPTCRSMMNVTFTLDNPDLEILFLAQAEAAGILSLKGHRAVGGMRASIYNAVPVAAVKTLIEFMADFERRH